jgi:hypothetical protein
MRVDEVRNYEASILGRNVNLDNYNCEEFFNWLHSKQIWELHFLTNNKHTLTGDLGYKSSSVFSNIAACVNDFLKTKENVDVLVFHSENARQNKLYEKIMGRLLPKYNCERCLRDPYFGLSVFPNLAYKKIGQ